MLRHPKNAKNLSCFADSKMMDYMTYMEAFKFMISRHKLFWKLKDQVHWIVSIRLPFSILTSAPCLWAMGRDLMDRIIHDLLLSNS